MIKSGVAAKDAESLVAECKSIRTAADVARLDIPEVDRVILEYAVKLTLTPADMQQSDVQSLRQAGLEDDAIHDVACVTGYFAFVNRVADGLGVQLEERFRG